MSSTGFGNAWTRRFFRRGPNAFILASVASGFAWYFAGQQVSNFNAHQSQLIRRVEQSQSVQNFKKDFEPHEADNWDCKKVNLDGVIGQGRIFVKRNRGKQQGYLVLAPFTVNQVITESIFDQDSDQSHNSSRKFVLNLGWLPRSRKYMAYDTIGSAYGQQVYPDYLDAVKKQQQDGLPRNPMNPQRLAPITNITAYVRKSQPEDKANGVTNWAKQDLYKWIDLGLFTKAFRIFNQAEGQSVYLQRTFKGEDDPESYPIQASKETVIEDLKNKSRNYERSASQAKNSISGLAFGLAAWMTFF